MNKVDITPEAVPVDPDTSFIMSPPSHVEEDLTGCKMARDAILIFCVDVSGSMCATTEVNALYTERKYHMLVSLLQGLFIVRELLCFTYNTIDSWFIQTEKPC